MAISKIILNGVTQMDVTQDTVAANNLLNGYTAHGADGAPVSGNYVPAVSNDFVVTLSWDSVNEVWEPDCTFAQIQAAYQAGKTIVVVTDSPGSSMVGGEYIDEGGGEEALVYSVGEVVMDEYTITLYALDSNGLYDNGDSTYIYPNFETVTKTYTPTESAQTETVTFGSNYNGLQEVDVTVNAISSSYVGSGITRRDSTDLSASGATVSVPSGYYQSNASKSVASGSATPAASISGTSATVSTGTNTLTLSKTVSNTPQVSAGYVSAGTAGNSNVSLTANVTTKAAATITPGTSNQTIASGTYLTGAQTISGDANLVAGNIKSGTTIFGVTGTYEGGGGSGMQVATKTTTLGAAAASISFSGLSGEPTSFAITTAADLATGASPWKTAAVTYDGTNLNGQIVTNTSNAQASHSTSFSKSYSNGTLTVTGTGTNFQANQYKLVYTYGGNSANLGTDDVQVGSGATSISFTGLTAEPDYFSLVFTSNFSTSSGYQRVMAVVYDGNSTYGVAMDSGAKALSSWSYTYNNGTLTVSSTGTNNGGYFHQPGDYHLTYGIGGTVEPVEIEVEPLSVTQNGTYTAPSGIAYSPVTVNVSGGGSLTVATKTATLSAVGQTLSFTSLSGTPKYWFVKTTSQISSSGSTTIYYITDGFWDGTSVKGNSFRIGSTRRIYSWTSGVTQSYSSGTLTITGGSATGSSPGQLYNGTYELTYVY